MSLREKLLRDALARLAEARDLASALASVSDDRVARAVLLAEFESAEFAFREFARHHLGLRIPAGTG
jgi:hypothetical protein